MSVIVDVLPGTQSLNHFTLSAIASDTSPAPCTYPMHSPANSVFSKLFSTRPWNRSKPTRHSFAISCAERVSANVQGANARTRIVDRSIFLASLSMYLSNLTDHVAHIEQSLSMAGS